jgi:hypothetical protein
MALGIMRRQASPAEPTARQLAPRPGAEQLIGELDELASLKEAGVLSEAEFARQREQILAALV